MQSETGYDKLNHIIFLAFVFITVYVVMKRCVIIVWSIFLAVILYSTTQTLILTSDHDNGIYFVGKVMAWLSINIILGSKRLLGIISGTLTIKE